MWALFGINIYKLVKSSLYLSSSLPPSFPFSLPSSPLPLSLPPSLPPSLPLSVPSIRLTGYSPFQGETHSHTFYNVSMCEYDFEDEVFDDVSQEAKDFIEELLQKKPRF